MERELACDIVKDLLPLYVEEMVSDVSKKSIETHLGHCTDCNEIYENMAYGMETEKQPSEIRDVKRFLKKTKQMYFLYGLGVLSCIAILACLIVDLALNKRFTWSLIAGSAVAFADAFVYVVIVCRKNKGYLAMSVVSIGTACLLSVIQTSRYCLMNTGTVWIFRYGFPIMLLWLGAVWAPLLLRYRLKCNIWDCIAVFMIMVIIGNYATKLITGDYEWNDVWSMRNFAGNAFGEVIAIVLFGFIGRVKKWRK